MGRSTFFDIFELVVAFDELPPTIEAESEPLETAHFAAEPSISHFEDHVAGATCRAWRAAPAPPDALAPADSTGYAPTRKRAKQRADRDATVPTRARFDLLEPPARQLSPKKRPRRAHAALAKGCYSEGSEGDDVRWIKATLSEWDDKVLTI